MNAISLTVIAISLVCIAIGVASMAFRYEPEQERYYRPSWCGQFQILEFSDCQ